MIPEEMTAIHGRAMTTSRPWSVAEIAGLLATETVFPLTRARGFALGRAAAGEAELLTLAVDPAAQRRGLGLELLTDFEREAVARGAYTAFLEVAEDNAPARALYARAGWMEAGRRIAYYARISAAPVDALILRKALP